MRPVSERRRYIGWLPTQIHRSWNSFVLGPIVYCSVSVAGILVDFIRLKISYCPACRTYEIATRF